MKKTTGLRRITTVERSSRTHANNFLISNQSPNLEARAGAPGRALVHVGPTLRCKRPNVTTINRHDTRARAGAPGRTPFDSSQTSAHSTAWQCASRTGSRASPGRPRQSRFARVSYGSRVTGQPSLVTHGITHCGNMSQNTAPGRRRQQDRPWQRRGAAPAYRPRLAAARGPRWWPGEGC